MPSLGNHVSLKVWRASSNMSPFQIPFWWGATVFGLWGQSLAGLSCPRPHLGPEVLWQPAREGENSNHHWQESKVCQRECAGCKEINWILAVSFPKRFLHAIFLIETKIKQHVPGADKLLSQSLSFNISRSKAATEF